MKDVGFKLALKRAMESGRFFITITHLEPSQDIDQESSLQHYTMTNEFPDDDIEVTLRHFYKNLQEIKGKGVVATKLPSSESIITPSRNLSLLDPDKSKKDN